MIKKILLYCLLSCPLSLSPLILCDQVCASNKVIDCQKRYYFIEISNVILLEDLEGKFLVLNPASRTSEKSSDQSGSDEEEKKPPAGCCKHKKSGSWKKNNFTKNQCIRKNRETDSDNVSQRKGVYWWDNRCQ